jgi:hypothetical protein
MLTEFLEKKNKQLLLQKNNNNNNNNSSFLIENTNVDSSFYDYEK